VSGGPECLDVQPELTELALGLLSGRERAAALAHVEGCPSCSAELEQLSQVADRLPQVAPEVEPPVGFETALFERLRHQGGPVAPGSARPAGRPQADRSPARRRRAVLAVAAAAVAAVQVRPTRPRKQPPRL